jgi:hypothetical protein
MRQHLPHVGGGAELRPVALHRRAKDHQAGFDLFQVVGLADRDAHELRELLTRFGVPFRFTLLAAGAAASYCGT